MGIATSITPDDYRSTAPTGRRKWHGGSHPPLGDAARKPHRRSPTYDYNATTTLLLVGPHLWISWPGNTVLC